MSSVETKVVLLGHSSTREHFTFGYGLARLKAFAMTNGVTADIQHLSRFYDDSEEEDLDLILAAKPAVLGLSSYLWNIDRQAKLVAQVRQHLPDTLIVMGGPSVLGYEESAGKTAPKPDYLVVGEGELPFLRLLQYFQEGTLADRESEVGSLVSFKGGEARRYPDQLPYQEMDTLTSPYLSGLGDAGSPVMYWETSRGCPFLCSFCVLSTKVNRMRYFSIPYLENELHWARENNRWDINICDAALNYHTDRLDALTAMMQQVDPQKNNAYTFALHADYLNPQQIPLLERINIKETTLGLNSINPPTYKEVKRRIVPERFRRAVSMLNQLCRPTVTVIMGLPGDTIDGFKQTLDFCATLDATIEIFELKVIPETTYFDKAPALGLQFDPKQKMGVIQANSYTPDDLQTMRVMAAEFESEAGRWRQKHFLSTTASFGGTVGRLRESLKVMGILKEPISYQLGPWQLQSIDAQDHTATLSLIFHATGFAPVKILLSKRTDQEKSFAHTAFFNLSHEGHGEIPKPTLEFLKAFHHSLCQAEQRAFEQLDKISTGT